MSDIKKRGRPRLSLEEKERRKKERAAMTPEQRYAASLQYGAERNLPNSIASYNSDGDNTRFILNAMKVRALPRVDMNDPVAVESVVNEYIKICAEDDLKPSVVGMAMALHMDRQTLWAIVNNQPYNRDGKQFRMPRPVTDLLKECYIMLESLWSDYMQQGKINPVSGIFLAKNHFGYKDVQDVVVQQDAKTLDDMDESTVDSAYDDHGADF